MKLLSAGRELDLSDARMGHQITRRMIEDFFLEDGEKLELFADQISEPAPYDKALEKMVILKTAGPTRLWEENKSLFVEGSVENLGVFASWLEFEDNAAPGTHYHFDPIGNDCVHETSLSAVISLEQS